VKRVGALLLAVTVTVPLGAQQGVAHRLRGAAPDVVRVVDSALALAASRGLPGEPLVQKAIEGTAKGAPADRVTAAVRALLERLGTSALALQAGGVAGANPAEIEAGAFALSAGLDSAGVATLARSAATANAVEVTLRVSGTLAAIGVPGAQVLELVSQALSAGEAPGRVLALPGQVRAAIARGATPAAAAAGLTRGAQGRAGAPDPPRGPPPGKGPPARP
jgi:hypothetical protein